MKRAARIGPPASRQKGVVRPRFWPKSGIGKDGPLKGKATFGRLRPPIVKRCSYDNELRRKASRLRGVSKVLELWRTRVGNPALRRSSIETLLRYARILHPAAL